MMNAKSILPQISVQRYKKKSICARKQCFYCIRYYILFVLTWQLLMPQQKTCLANLVLYKSNQIASWENCSLGSDRLIKKISLSGVIYNVPEIYGQFLDNLNAYEHYESVQSFNSGYTYVASYYEYYLIDVWYKKCEHKKNEWISRSFFYMVGSFTCCCFDLNKKVMADKSNI